VSNDSSLVTGPSLGTGQYTNRLSIFGTSKALSCLQKHTDRARANTGDFLFEGKEAGEENYTYLSPIPKVNHE